jgi:hypothetical protein
MVLHPAADLRIAPLRGHKEIRGALSAQAQMEIEGKSRRVKRRTQISGSRRQRQPQRSV